MAAPRGQLSPTATNRDIANRVIDIDEAGEDCRQHLTRVKTKIDIYHEIMDQINSGHKPKKKD